MKFTHKIIKEGFDYGVRCFRVPDLLEIGGKVYITDELGKTYWIKTNHIGQLNVNIGCTYR